jgi:hypothetical protein
VELAHNTGTGPAIGLLLIGVAPVNSLLLRDNILGGNPALASADGMGFGIPALDYHTPGWTALGNVFIGASANGSPAGNVYSASAAAAGLSTDLRVLSAPALGTATTDGLSPGADRAQVEQKTAGVIVP